MPSPGFASKLPEGDGFALIYFPLMAKGLGPALVAEFSGLPWRGPRTLPWDRSLWGGDDGYKASGESPLGQLPLLEMDGVRLSQTTAIINHIAHRVGGELEGATSAAFAVSQMLLAEGEDLYTLMQKSVGTLYRPQSTKGGTAAYDEFWASAVPPHLTRLEAMLGGAPEVPSAARGAWVPGETAGELYLFATLHQMALLRPDAFAATPRLEAFYRRLLGDGRVKRVMSGESPFGELKQYFVGPCSPEMGATRGSVEPATGTLLITALLVAKFGAALLLQPGGAQ